MIKLQLTIFIDSPPIPKTNLPKMIIGKFTALIPNKTKPCPIKIKTLKITSILY